MKGIKYRYKQALTNEKLINFCLLQISEMGDIYANVAGNVCVSFGHIFPIVNRAWKKASIPAFLLHSSDK